MGYVTRAHPIALIRARLGLPRGRFGTLCGVTRLTVELAEKGGIIEPRKLVTALARLGVVDDAEALTRDCRAWAAENTAAMAAELGLSAEAD